MLAAALVIWTLPPAFALNCTLYESDQHELCSVIDPLDVSDTEKESLMQPNIYTYTEFNIEPIELTVSPSEEQVQTFDTIYEQNIQKAFQILLFTLVHYCAYSYATRSSSIIQWLRVDSLT